MSKEKKSREAGLNEEIKEFAGYTLEELKHQRALALVKKEFLKQKAMNDIDSFKSKLPFNGNSPFGNISPKGILGKVVKGLNYADYFMIGLSVFSAGRKVMSLFRKRR